MIGKRLSHFDLVEELGSGGMGRVFRAYDVDLQRQVAIKVLPKDALASEARRQRFVREARAASSLNHPGIVTIFEIGSAGGVDFIAMEVVEGERLEVVAGDEGLPVARVVDLGLQIAEALVAAHAAGIVHRDLKPANVMVSPGGRVKILDFGLAKWRLDPGTDPMLPTLTRPESLTGTGLVVGTPHYMAPEQIQGREVDERTDVFAFGCILYRLLTGRPAFAGASAAEVMSSVLRDSPAAVSATRCDVPGDLEALVARCLAKRPAERPQSAAALVGELERLRQARPGPREVPEATAGAPADRRGGRWWPIAAVTVAVVTVGALLMVDRLTKEAPRLRASSFRAVSDAGGDHRQGSLSPDGRLVAYVTEGAEGIAQVWVKDLSGGEAIQVTAAEANVSRPRWAPQGEIVYAVEGAGIWSVPALGGSSRRLVGEGQAPDVAEDGSLVFVRGGELWGMGPGVEKPRKISGPRTTYFARLFDLAPALSPDGRWICYFQTEPDQPVGDLWVVGSDGGEPRRLTHQRFWGGQPDWTPDGRTVVFSSDAAGSRTLWSVPASGGEPRPLTTGTGEDGQPSIGPRGDRLVYTNARNKWALVRRDRETGEETVLLERRVPIAMPDVSPAGGRIAFFGTAEEGSHLFTIGVDGSHLLQLTRGIGGNTVPRWSADGARIFYYRRGADPALASVPAEGGESVDVVRGWRWVEQTWGAVDPEQRRVAYKLLRPGAPSIAMIRDLATGAERELAAAIAAPSWSPSGDAVFGMTLDGGIFRCSPDDGSCRRIAPGFRPQWGPDGRVYAIQPLGDPFSEDAGPVALWSVLPDGTDRRFEGELAGFRLLTFGYDVLPDGDVVWSSFAPGRKELWLAELGEE